MLKPNVRLPYNPVIPFQAYALKTCVQMFTKRLFTIAPFTTAKLEKPDAQQRRMGTLWFVHKMDRAAAVRTKGQLHTFRGCIS